MDFTQEDLFEAIERAVRETLAQARVVAPPVDALEIAQANFGFRVEFAEPEDEPRQYGDRPKRKPGPNTILLREDQSEESQHLLAARGIAKYLLPGIFTKLGIVPTTENKSGVNQLIGLLVPRLLLPTNWFGSEARKSGFDLVQLKERYTNVGFEMLAWRMLDVDEEPSVIAIVDDGNVVSRKSNRFSANKKLTPAEQACLDEVSETNEPTRKRLDEWTAWGWPTIGIPYRRIILRAAPDEV